MTSLEYGGTTTEISRAGGKSFSFVSVVMEPSKSTHKTMRLRDKNKPLVDQAIVDKQIRF